jgi:hypothetical protein
MRRLEDEIVANMWHYDPDDDTVQVCDMCGWSNYLLATQRSMGDHFTDDHGIVLRSDHNWYQMRRSFIDIT